MGKIAMGVVSLRVRTKLFLSLGVLLLLLPSFSEGMPRYVNNKDGSIKDNSTGLVWVKNPESSPQIRGTMIWIDARDNCKELVHGGVGPNVWRLPNIDELQSILAETSSSPRIDTTFFDGIPSVYWSVTNASGPGAYAWVVDFSNGQLGSKRKLNLLSPELHRARCVRAA